MNHSSFRCAACGSQSLRRSHRHSVFELPKMVTGQYPFRCNECHHRFFINVWATSVWTPSKGKCARCPYCLGLKLDDWPQNRRPHFWQRVMIRFGANRYRCTTCRTNFVTFRKRSAGRVSFRETPDSPDQGAPAPERDEVLNSRI